MSVSFDFKDDTLTLYLSGEIDHHNAKNLRQKADSEILRLKPPKVILSFKDVSFMDSSGIGLIMGRYKLVSGYGGSVFIMDASAYLKRVMRLAGLDSIVTIIQSAPLGVKEEVK